MASHTVLTYREIRTNGPLSDSTGMCPIILIHWVWHRCPIAWQGQYQDRNHERSIVVEAIAGHDMNFFQAFVGLPGSLNDINIMGRTDLQNKYMSSTAYNHSFDLDGDPFTGTFSLYTQ